jgi:hypothetical protein
MDFVHDLPALTALRAELLIAVRRMPTLAGREEDSEASYRAVLDGHDVSQSVIEYPTGRRRPACDYETRDRPSGADSSSG